ncbi:hypothetical protein BG005_000163, partial [Podila minutissima]
MFANKTFRLFVLAAVATFMLFATVEAAPTKEATVAGRRIVTFPPTFIPRTKNKTNMLANKTFNIFVIAAAFMLLVIVEAAPAEKAAVK